MEKFGVPWKYEYWTTSLPKSISLTGDGKESELLWDPKVKTLKKMEHNHPDMILKLPEGQVASIIQFTVCRDLSVMTHKVVKSQQLAEDWAKKYGQRPTVPIVVGTRGVVPERTVEALKTLTKWRAFDVPFSRFQKAAAIGSGKVVWKTVRSSGRDAGGDLQQRVYSQLRLQAL